MFTEDKTINALKNYGMEAERTVDLKTRATVCISNPQPGLMGSNLTNVTLSKGRKVVMLKRMCAHKC